MSKSSTPSSTSKSNKGEVKPTKNTGDPRAVFMGAVVSMSWQLAIVVLVPVIAGYQIDQHFKTSPIWTIVGFVIAVIGVVMVIRRMLSELNQHFINPEAKR